MEEIVSWCFEPSQPQRITLGLPRTAACVRGAVVSVYRCESIHAVRKRSGCGTAAEAATTKIEHRDDMNDLPDMER